MSVTVKGHGSEDHIVNHMRDLAKYGGMVEFDESWGELYHQIGYRFDVRLRNMGSEDRKARTRAKRDRSENLPQTKVAAMLVEETFKPKRKKKSIVVKKEKAKIKMERREIALSGCMDDNKKIEIKKKEL